LSKSGFNPRAREGRDDVLFLLQDFSTLFQSTRPRRARLLQQFDRNGKYVSIHAPAKGATRPDEVL